MFTSLTSTETQAAKSSTMKGASFSDAGNMPFFQPKLTVNTPGDAHEQEADRVADQVMRMKESDTPIAQRMPLTSVSGVQRKCSECEHEEQEQVQRKETAGSDSGGKSAPSIVSEVISSGGGQPMDGRTRQFMESRFGQDFGQVRIHTDSQAAESASAIQARAYTSGRDVVFGKGEYRPSSEEGKRLIAHELTHVGQQQGRGKVQRAVLPTRVHCNRYPRTYPIFRAIGTEDPVGVLQAADSRAITLLQNTIQTLQDIVDAVRGGAPVDRTTIPACVADALRFQMNINPDEARSWTGNGPGTVAHLIHRYTRLLEVMRGGWIRYDCLGRDCEAGDDAYMIDGQGYLIHLCRGFWRMASVEDQGLTLIHELAHIYFVTEDWGFTGPGSSHCLEQFIALLSGIPVPAAYRGACRIDQITTC